VTIHVSPQTCLQPVCDSPTLVSLPTRHEDFDWAADDSVVIPQQPETACYRNEAGQIVIRQRHWPDDDSFVYINPESLPRIIAALTAEGGL
jgi:hypothetical protein